MIQSFYNKWSALILLVIFTCITHQKIIKNPENFLVTGGDGSKNYYTFLYHIQRDSSWLTFEGMNYPFGENIVFTDNQPLLAISVKFLVQFFPELSCHLITLHNLLLVFGWLLGAWGLFLSLRRLDVSWYWAIVTTMALFLLQPQNDRMNGHFALAYPVIPWLFYGWIRYWQGGKILTFSLFLGFMTTVMGMIHMYYFVIAAILASIALFAQWMTERPRPSIVQVMTIFFIQVVVPFIIIHTFASLGHHYADRPTEPWGFFAYRSYWEGLFFSFRLPLYEFIHHNIVEVRPVDQEGRSYVGIFGVVVMFWGMYALIKLLTKRKVSGQNPIRAKLWWIFILTALVAFGIPFIIPGFETMLDYTGPFKQFRSIGRVAWLSFYAINLIAVPWILRQVRTIENLVKKRWLYILLPWVLMTEGILFIQKKPDYSGSSERYNCDSDLKNLPVQFKDYQAILPNPFFHNGSEGFLWDGQANNVGQCFELSYQTGLPIMATMMSRTPMHQTLLHCALVNPPVRVPDIIQQLKEKDSRPLLVVESKLPLENPKASINYWTDSSPVIFENDEFSLRRLDLSTFDTVVSLYNPPLKNMLTSYSFEKIKSQKGWGYEAFITEMDILRGKVILEYNLEVSDATRILSTTEVFQFDQNSGLIDYQIEGNRWNYNHIEGQDVTISFPVFIKNETTKLVIRYEKFNQRKRHDIRIFDGRIYRSQ